MKYDYLVFIGRFQPFHLGHREVIDRALQLSNKVIVLVGGYGKARSPRNPWTFEERKEFIRSVYPTNRVNIKPLRDFTYNDSLWLQSVQDIVHQTIKEEGTSYGVSSPKIGLIGCNKDHTSYYINLFPQWGNEAVEFVNPINATDIRDSLFGFKYLLEDQLPTSVANIIRGQDYSDIAREYNYYSAYKKAFSNNAYETQHLTADAVVIQSGHILLVKRRAEPGKGLWALPGGFKNPTETFKQAALRELKEETKIKVPLPVLEGSITATFDADNPNRSERGVVVSKVFKFELKPGELPKVKGSDDAEKARWVPLAELREDMMFEDHYHIIRELV